jgi:cytochrome c
MNYSRFLLAFVGMLSLALWGCGPGGSEDQAGETAGAADGEIVDINALVANADVKRGQMLFLQCRACHSLAEGEPNKVGPNLHGVFGRNAGLAPGFAYSDAFVNAGVAWSPETLNEFLERPSQYIPGNRMVFVGVRKPADRANLIAFLQQATAEN